MGGGGIMYDDTAAPIFITWNAGSATVSGKKNLKLTSKWILPVQPHEPTQLILKVNNLIFAFTKIMDHMCA